MHTHMRTKAIITAALIAATTPSLIADTIVTGRPDAFGRTTSVIYADNGRVIARAITNKPDAFGRRKTTYVSNRGKVVAESQTDMPDSFGRRITRFLKLRKARK